MERVSLSDAPGSSAQCSVLKPSILQRESCLDNTPRSTASYEVDNLNNTLTATTGPFNATH